MAKAKGIMKIEGTVEDLTFYRMDGKNYVRTKGGVSRERIMKDSNFARTRENMMEFAENAHASKMLRMSVGSMSFRAKDSRLSSRLTGIMSRIKNFDSNSARGERLVSRGIRTEAGRQVLKGFDFNMHSSLNYVFHAPYVLDVRTGELTIERLVTEEQILYPQGATNVSFQSAVVDMDFETGNSVIAYSEVVDLPIRMGASDVTLTPSSLPAGLGVQLFLLLITFSQEINSVLYPLKNEEFNVLQIIDVVAP